MKRNTIGLFLILASSIVGFAQENLDDKIKLNKLILEFEESIITKDSIRFKKVFFDNKVAFIGIMSKKSEASIKKDYPEFVGTSVSNCDKFISQICQTDKRQKEIFYDILIKTDRSIASINFDYCFMSDDKMIQWGHEKWNVVKIENEWLITDVIYSIHFPDIEEFPYELVQK